MNLEQLRARLAELRAQAQGILDAATARAAGSDMLTEAEATAFDEAMAAAETVQANISRVERLGAARTSDNIVNPARAAGPVTGAVRSGGDPAVASFESFSHFLATVAYNQNDTRLAPLWNDSVGGGGADGAEANQNMGTGSAGGFMVPNEFRDTLFAVTPQASLVRPRAQVIPPGSSPDAGIDMPYLDQTPVADDGVNPNAGVYGGVTVAWTEEGAVVSGTDAKFGMVTLQPHEMTGLAELTNKLLRNWSSADGIIRGLISGAMRAAEDVSYLRGNGVKKPLGIMNSPALVKVARATANTFAYADAAAMLAKVLMRGGSPTWSAPQSVLPQLLTMRDPEGHLVWQPNARDGVPGTLLGYPLFWNNRQPALGTVGDVVLADWGAYLIKDGAGPFFAASEHAKFTENKTLIKVLMSVDGQPWQKQPFTEENGYAVSPFVALDIPAA